MVKPWRFPTVLDATIHAFLGVQVPKHMKPLFLVRMGFSPTVVGKEDNGKVPVQVFRTRKRVSFFDVGLPARPECCSTTAAVYVWVLQIQSKHFQTFFGNCALPLFKVFLIVSQPFSPFTPFKTASIFGCLLFPLAFVPHCIPRVFLLAVFSKSKSVVNKQHHLSRRVALLIPTLPTPGVIGGEASSRQILLTFT